MWHGVGDIRVQEVERPEPGPSEALVRTRAAGICGSDLHFLVGRCEPPRAYAGGHEMAGEIVEVGPKVRSLAPGDRVCVEPIVYCGECAACRRGETNLCQRTDDYVSMTCHGGFAEYFAAPEMTLHKLPDAMSMAEGAMMEPFAVSMHALRLARPAPGDTILVLGAGTIGLTAVVAARLAGAGQVLCTAKYAHQRTAAERLGASEVLGPDAKAIEEAVKGATGGVGADVVVETVGGVSDTTELALRAAREGGTIMLVGQYPQPIEVPLAVAIFRQERLIGSNCYAVIDGKRDFHVCMEATASGRADLAPLVTHVFALEQIGEAMQTALDKSSGAIKVQIAYP
jgi:2-desacetyl-2-hydroxyethyl bacteriochlorophyllide A dehydrogenase